MQMVGFFARRIVVVSGGGLAPSALSRVATLQNSTLEAAQHPATSKSRRFVCIGTSSKSPNGGAPGSRTSGRRVLRGPKAPLARRCHGRAVYRITADSADHLQRV